MRQRRAQSLPPEMAQAVWRLTHRRYAEMCYELILSLKGMWVKTGQYLSSRPDVMPEVRAGTRARAHPLQSPC